VLFKVDPTAIGSEEAHFCNRLILARVKDSAPTPIEANVQQTLFQMHKLQASPDPITQKDFQWGALSASIVGTFFDEADGKNGNRIGFGNDVDTFLSPFSYVVYMPTEEHLAALINSFVRSPKPFEIGQLRYTETPSPTQAKTVAILVDPRDLVGEPNAAQRLANFGKTRYGKSNSSKIISTAVFESGMNVAQVFFDPSGEYTYINEQDGTSLFALYNKRAIRYALAPKQLRNDEKELSLEPSKPLKLNFYEFPSVGQTLILSLWSTENDTTPGYMRPILDWSPVDPVNAPKKSDVSGFNLGRSALRKRKNGRYVAKKIDQLLRVVNVLTTEGRKEIATRDSRQASLVGGHWAAVQKFIQTGDDSALLKFAKKRIVDARRKRYLLLTDLKELERLASAGVLRFESMYAGGA
jgi:hypothetical protein